MRRNPGAVPFASNDRGLLPCSSPSPVVPALSFFRCACEETSAAPLSIAGAFYSTIATTSDLTLALRASSDVTLASPAPELRS